MSAKKGMNFASKNGQWKGDNVGYGAIHEWIAKRLYKPLKCKDCGEIKKLELCNISNNYKRDINDWEWLCRKCHMIKDGRLNRLINLPHVSYIPNEETKNKIRMANRTGKNINCNTCNKEFYRKPSHVTINNYCSKKCFYIRKIRRVI